MNKLDLFLKLSYKTTQSRRMLITMVELEQIGLRKGSSDFIHTSILLEIKNIATCQEVEYGILITLTDNGIRFCENDSFSSPHNSLVKLKIST